MNKCSSQSAFSRTFALLMSSPSCCVHSSPLEQHGKWGKDRTSCQLMTEEQGRWQEIQGAMVM